MRILLVVSDPARSAALLHAGAFAHLDLRCHRDDPARLTPAKAAAFDALVLEWPLAGADPLVRVTTWRRSGMNVPLLFCTAHESVAERVRALDAGADDCISPATAPEEVIARAQAIGRRGQPLQVSVMVADLCLDALTHEVSRAGRSIALTPHEFVLLEALMRASPHVLRRDQLLDAVWGIESDRGSAAINTSIRRLRVAVDASFAVPLIQTVHGVGYVLRTPSARRY